jgi:hypothetical protein
VAKDGVLELELCDGPTSGEQPDEAHQNEVGEGSQGARDATYQRQSSAEPSFGAPQLTLRGQVRWGRGNSRSGIASALRLKQTSPDGNPRHA